MNKTAFFRSLPFSVFSVHLSIGVISNLKPQFWAPNFSPISCQIFPIFSGMEEPWKVFHPPSKDLPKLLPVSPNLKGNVMVWGTPNHLKWDFGAKMVKKRFLTQKYKNNKFSRFLRKFVKTPITHQREARKLELCASPSPRNLYT